MSALATSTVEDTDNHNRLITQSRLPISAIGYWLLTAAVFFVTLLGNLLWVRDNVVLLGRDAGGHLWRSLQYADVLETLSLRTVFQALTFHHYRPPAFYLLAQPFYRLFGFSPDAAQLQNLCWFALILLLTLIYGWRFYNRWVGLLAMSLTAFLPMLAAMTRLFYLENLVTVMVLCSLLALASSNGFVHRGWSLVWGIGLGVGMLVKWTMPAYVLLPSLYVAWLAIRHAWGQKNQIRFAFSLRKAGISVLVGGVIILPMTLANIDVAADLALGKWLFVLCGGLLVATIYLLQQPASRINNLLAGSALGLFIASIWYLPRINFIYYLGEAAYGEYGGNYEAFHVLHISNYTRYFSYLLRQHLGAVPALFLLPALVVWFNDFRNWRRLTIPSWLLWLSILSTYLAFSFASQDGERNIVPVLPALMLLVAATTMRLPKRWGLFLALLWATVLGVQWLTLAFDRFDHFGQTTKALWVSGEFLARPASGATDPRYWIAPDVLARIVDATPPNTPPSFGMLVNSEQIHRGVFHFLIQRERLDVELFPLTNEEMTGFGDLFAFPWILLKDGDNKDVAPVGRAAIDRILAGDRLFNALYDPVAVYPLPNGETAQLFHRALGPAHPHANPDMLQAGATIAEHLRRWQTPDARVVIPDATLAVWLVVSGFDASSAILPADAVDVQRALAQSGSDSAFVVLADTPSPAVEWLNAHWVKALEVGDAHMALAIYGRPSQALVEHAIASRRGEVTIDRARAPGQAKPGSVIQVELDMNAPQENSRKVSIRLVDPQGNVVAQNDQVTEDHLTAGLFLPPDLETGRYSIVAIPYDAATGIPLANETAKPEVLLAEIMVPD